MEHKCLLLAAIALACAGLTRAQSTLGEILDRGATKISKDEWLAKLPVTTTDFWPAGRRGETQFRYSPDGTLVGTLFDYASGTSTDAAGTWTVDDAGKVCTSHRNLAPPPGWRAGAEECSIRYQLGDKTFRIVSEPERSAKIIKTVVSR
jgi:hypothetical protein